MRIVYAAILSFLLDLLLGDPEGILHPVIIMGRCISVYEKKIRPRFPNTPGGELAAGAVLAVLLPVGTFCVCLTVIRGLNRIHPAAGFPVEVFWGWQALAVRDLCRESRNVYDKLKTDTLEAARKAVSRIVGRDTENLSKEGVTRAAVETVAESFSDGIIAPMCFLLLGGAPLALCYKAINTMDSMIGYKNARYLYFGRCAAKLDDAANFIPSRLAAMLLIGSAVLCRQDGKNARRIWRRDRRKHASPNSAQTESVMAGALDVQLAGPAYYFGEYYEKPTIGDPIRPVKEDDIPAANRMILTGSAVGLVLFCLLRAVLFL